MKDFLNYKGYLSKLSKSDLKELLIKLKTYQLRYRQSLGIDEHYSFAPEIEFEQALLYYVLKELSKDLAYKEWQVKEDKSCCYKIDGFIVGGEVVPPALHDVPTDWQNLSNILKVLKQLKAKTTNKTSLHVHIGSQIFGDDIKNIINFIKVWCVFEHIIFKFSYGEDYAARPDIIYFAKPISYATNLKVRKIPDYFSTIGMPRSLSYDRRYAVNLKNYYDLITFEELGNTIEIRCANGTLKRHIIQNTINFYLKLMLYVTSPNFDEQLIDRLFNRLKVKELADFNKTYLKGALILVDLIFDNSLDKINFLKQYIKKDEIISLK